MSNTNKQLRAKADAIAARVARAIGLPKPPKCARITRRRGRGYTHAFSIPAWAAAHEAYFAYYVAHEVCHAHPQGQLPGHGYSFRRLEALALAELNMAPVYEKGGAGPYVDALTNLHTGNVVCVRVWPLDPVDPPIVYTSSQGGAQ